MIVVELPGTPRPKNRPRFTRSGHTYTDAKTKAAEESLLAAWLVQSGRPAPFDGPISVELLFVFAPAQSWSKKKRAAALSGELRPTGRPDLDNLIKVIDALNGVAWVDDAQITRITATKRYGLHPFTRLTVLDSPLALPQPDTP